MKSHIIVLVLSLLFTAVLLISICVRNHPIEDTVPPQWRNQKQSDAVIPRSGYISLQAEAIDSVSLYKAVLSTNETGVWRNETEYALLWTQPAVCGFDNFGTATYEGDILYAPSKADNKVYAINASNGDIIWNSTVRQCDASPCIDNDVLYVGECSDPYGEPTSNPKAIALNKTSGEEIWHFTEPDGSEWVGSPLVCGDYVYYTTIGSGVYALNKTDGNPIWHRDIGYVVCSVAYDEGMIFVSDSNSTNPQGQYAFNATTGDEIWHANYGASWDSSTVLYDGTVIQVARNSVTSDWTTYVLNETDGELIRKFDGKGSPSTPLVHDDKIFIPSEDWKMWTFDLKTGKELWHTVNLHNGTPQNYSYCSPAAAGGAIYYQSLNGTFYVINETDGNVLWSYALAGFGFGSPSIGDGKVFITNDAGLYAFRISPGSGDWTMFCQNKLHRGCSEQGIEYVRWPLTQPNDFGNVSDVWMTAKFVWCNKTITSPAIAWRIYFYDGAGNVNVTGTKIFYVNMPIHNVAIINVVLSETEIEPNQTMLINVTAMNKGNYTETFSVTLYYDSDEVGNQTLTLDAGKSTVLTFKWNTTGVPYGTYILGANASIVPGETATEDNTHVVECSVKAVSEFPLTVAVAFLLFIIALIVAILVRKRNLERRIYSGHA